MISLQSENTLGIVSTVKGEELKAFREKHGFTQEALARELNIPTNTLARWERNERRVPPFLNLALETIQRNLQKPH